MAKGLAEGNFSASRNVSRAAANLQGGKEYYMKTYKENTDLQRSPEKLPKNSS
jgi:hypothetical protein